ncbi:hypothetical protein ABIC09_002321 [Bradyrhizobium sp. S3.12.5]|uniref:hypothetical protein n=1 Tax=Bradyrhizobium sp. S3.12.5 TaxID=3156386 RepID=UPI0033951E91
MVKRWAALFVCACLLVIAVSSKATIFDQDASGADADILRQLAPSLLQNGVDTVLGSALKFGISGRPRLAPLKGYHAEKRNWDEILPSSWALGFQQGMFGALVAFKSSKLMDKKADCDLAGNIDVDACAFVNGWLNADPNSRIFIAFTKMDLAVAAKVKKALEQNGYTVFMFLKAGQSTPWADESLVGEVFTQAAHRFVLDTANSRGSVGVALESKLCEFLLTPPPPLSRWAKLIKGGA